MNIQNDDIVEREESLPSHDFKKAREAILFIEAAMLSNSVEGIEVDDHNISCPVKHHFAPGMYGREMFIPKGYVAVGKIHKHSHLAAIIQGEVSILTERGTEKIKAPQISISFPGAKRVAYAHEDTILVTFHPTEETDLEKIEDYVIAESFEEYDKYVLEQSNNKELEI